MEHDPTARVPRNVQFRVGLLLGLTLMLAVGFLVYVLYARGVFEDTLRLTLVADNVEGLAIGSDLTFSGFPIGRVQRIALGEDGRARIEVHVPRAQAKWLRVSSIFTLERGIVGGARLRAFSGNLEDPPLPDGAERSVLRGDTQEEIPRMVAMLRGVLENVEQITGDGGSLQASLANLRTVTERMNGPHGALGAVLGSDEEAKKLLVALERVNALLAALAGVARRVDATVAKADQRVLGAGGLVDGAERVIQQVNGILDDVRESLARVDRILQDAQAVSGNARAATADLEALRAEVDASLRKVNGLIDEVNRKWPFRRESEIRLP